MALKIILNLLFVILAESLVINDNSTSAEVESDSSDLNQEFEDNAATVFDGVYTECFLHLSYSCLQKKTLLYLKELNKLSEVSVIGDYVKFVKVNETESEDHGLEVKHTEDLSFMIDNAVDRFFSNHILKFNAMGKDIGIPETVEEFVGRKRKGGGGGGGHGGGHGGGGDGGKKKMMMMAMMCMKMKFMMMVPAMMGMMGMMSFKGMMFSMMSFMLSKMMLLMKLLEKKGGGGGGGGGGGWDGGWAAGGGGGGGAWMPAGGQDGGGGGGYDANAQWQSRSIIDKNSEKITAEIEENRPIISYVTPIVRYNNYVNGKKPFSILKKLNDEVIKSNQDAADKPKSRRKRGIVDVLQNAYLYWINRFLGSTNVKQYQPKYPKFKVINGVKYVYYPLRQLQKHKTPKELPVTNIKVTDSEGFKPIITAEDFNKGEIVEGPVESRMTKKSKFKEMQETVNDALDDSPWQ